MSEPDGLAEREPDAELDLEPEPDLDLDPDFDLDLERDFDFERDLDLEADFDFERDREARFLVGDRDPDLDREREAARFLVGEREPDLELALDPLADRDLDLDLEPLEPDGDRDRPDWFSSPAPKLKRKCHFKVNGNLCKKFKM